MTLASIYCQELSSFIIMTSSEWQTVSDLLADFTYWTELIMCNYHSQCRYLLYKAYCIVYTANSSHLTYLFFILFAGWTLKSYCTFLKSSSHHAVVCVSKCSNSTSLKLHKTLYLYIYYFVENCDKNAKKVKSWLIAVTAFAYIGPAWAYRLRNIAENGLGLHQS